MSKSIQRVSSGAPWEAQFGYCRAVRVGDMIAVSGTAAVDADGQIVGDGDPEAQARRCLEIIESALIECGATLADVVRTRVYVRSADDWQAVGRAHSAAFGDQRPATTLVEVSRLIDTSMLVEIEADAIVTNPSTARSDA